MRFIIILLLACFLLITASCKSFDDEQLLGQFNNTREIVKDSDSKIDSLLLYIKSNDSIDEVSKERIINDLYSIRDNNRKVKIFLNVIEDKIRGIRVISTNDLIDIIGTTIKELK